MKISVITPSFNSGQYIERAIKSVLIQDYDNWEHIIVDGGSTDSTSSIVEKYSHIKYISEPDKGQSDAMNKGFNLSSGEILVYLNADDEFLPGVFSHVIKKFESTQSDIVIGCLYKVFPEKEPIFDCPSDNLMSILNYWPCSFPLNSFSYFYTTDLQRKIGDFPTDNHFAMDYWFILRAYKVSKFVLCNRAFGNFYFLDNKSSDVRNAKRCLRKVRNDFFRGNPADVIRYMVFWQKEIISKVFRRFGLIMNSKH